MKVDYDLLMTEMKLARERVSRASPEEKARLLKAARAQIKKGKKK